MMQLLSNTEINRELWDACIENSTHSEIYAVSWFLDIVSPGWKAFVYNNYEAVMPLPVKKKFGFSYIVQPPFCQKLGIFSNTIISSELIPLFEAEIIKFRSIRYASYNPVFSEKTKKNIRNNYILSLNKPYEDLYKNYNTNTKRNIKKSENNTIQITNISESDFLEFYSKSFNFSVPQIYKDIMPLLLQKGNAMNQVWILGAYLHSELQSATAFFITKNKIYYLFTCGSKESKNNGAMFSIIDFCIKKFANSSKILDFEGSSIPGVAQFYKGFGASNEPYYFYSIHRPHFIQKLMK